MKYSLVAITLGFGLFFSSTAQAEAPLEVSIEVDKPIGEVWDDWTTLDTLQTFFWKKMIFTPEPGTLFEVHYFPTNPAGARGVENARIMIVEPLKRISFSWGTPGWAGKEMRKQKTFVQIHFREITDNKTSITFEQYGWGDTEAWQDVKLYFVDAWGVTLDRYAYTLEDGPIDWDNIPEGLSVRPPAKYLTK